MKCLFAAVLSSNLFCMVDDPWDAEKYALQAWPQQNHAIKLFDIMIKPHLKGNEFILDLGCGPGRVTHPMSLFVQTGHVLGIDNSAKMIDYANHHFSNCNVTFQKFPVEVFLEPTNDLVEKFHTLPVDVITSFMCFHFIPKMDGVIKALFNCLKPGGTLLATVVVSTNDSLMINDALEIYESITGRKLNIPLPSAEVIKEKYRNYLIEIGNQVHSYSVDSERYHFSFADGNELVNWISAVPTAKFIRDSLTADQLTEFKKQFYQRCQETAKIVDGRLQWYLDLLVIRAKKAASTH